ncbi:MAG: PH domain-containing protein [Thermoanaerobaculia bacterium]
MLQPQKPAPSAPSATGAFVRKAGRWTLGILVAAVVLLSALLWLLNRAFTTGAPVVHASRLTGGNALFPVQVTVFPDRLSRYKPGFLGHTEDSIPINQIASVKVQAGVVFADVVVDSTGGSPAVVIHGLWKADAEVLKNRITEARNVLRPATTPAPTPAPPSSS